MILTGDPASINVFRHLRINPESRIQMQEKVSTIQNKQKYPGQCVVVPPETASFDRCSRKLSGAPCGRLPLTSFANSWRSLVALVSDFRWAILGSNVVIGGYGATAARLTPDQKVGSSNLSALTVTVFCTERTAMGPTNCKTTASGRPISK